MAEVIQTDESTINLEPVSDDDSILAGMFFERITMTYPDWEMHERSDLAMQMFSVVKQWAHNLELTSESHKIVELPETE